MHFAFHAEDDDDDKLATKALVTLCRGLQPIQHCQHLLPHLYYSSYLHGLASYWLNNFPACPRISLSSRGTRSRVSWANSSRYPCPCHHRSQSYCERVELLAHVYITSLIGSARCCATPRRGKKVHHLCISEVRVLRCKTNREMGLPPPDARAGGGPVSERANGKKRHSTRHPAGLLRALIAQREPLGDLSLRERLLCLPLYFAHHVVAAVLVVEK